MRKEGGYPGHILIYDLEDAWSGQGITYSTRIHGMRSRLQGFIRGTFTTEHGFPWARDWGPEHCVGNNVWTTWR